MENVRSQKSEVGSRKFNWSIFIFQLSIILLASFLAGCGKPQSDSEQIRRARIVGDENLTLKKEIEGKDKQLAGKEKQIAELMKQAQDDKAGLAEQIDQLMQDNKGLEARYTESQQNSDKAAAEYQASLNACQEQLNAKPTPCEEVEAKYAELHGKLLQMLSECATKLEQYEEQK